jgi:hypothetical protein
MGERSVAKIGPVPVVDVLYPRLGHAAFDSTYYYIHTSPDFMDAYAQITRDSQSLLPDVGFG